MPDTLREVERAVWSVLTDSKRSRWLLKHVEDDQINELEDDLRVAIQEALDA